MSQLRSFVERIERLREEKRTIEDDIKEVYIEIASAGFDKKVVREVVKRRSKDATELTAFEDQVELYIAEINGPSREHARDTRETPSGAEAGSGVRASAPIQGAA